ncbi:hypothetical protein [Neoaquamicrobium sediminum]|uniref:hypothetical protein n=1 Tax=Neoaquamicrobium sediminum TaxID=1849104 RepID=UPI00403689BC
MANDLADAVILLPQLLALYDASLVSATTSSAVKTAAEHGLAEVAASIKNSGRHGRKARETGKPGVAGIGLQQPLPRQLSPSAAQGFLVHPSAETVALIPAESLNALLTTLRSRLVFLDARRLYLVLKALAQMRLHPGRVFLAAHLQALTPLMRNISLGDKERINKGYAVLSEAKSAPLLRIQRSSAHRIVQATPFRKIPGRPLYRLDDEVEVTSSRLGESAQPSVKPHAKHRRDGRAEGGRQAGDTRRQLNKSPAESTDGDAKRSALTTKGVSNARQRLWAVSK